MWAWMSTPPGITTIPRASIRRASGPTSATTLPSSRHTSRISPSTSLAGSWTRPPLIRIALTARPPSSSRVSSAAAVGAPSGRGACSVSGTPSSRCAVPAAATPGGRGADPHLDPAGSRARSQAAGRARTRRAASRRRSSSGCVASTSSGMTAGEIHAAAVPGLPGQHVVGAPGPGGARQLERDHVALVAQRPDQLVQRERPSLTAARRRSGRVRTRTPHGAPRPAARSSRSARRQFAQAWASPRCSTCRSTSASRSRSGGQRSRSVGARARSRCRGRRRPPARARPTATAPSEAEPLEQPRMGRLRILAPDHDQPRAVADLAQRGGRDARAAGPPGRRATAAATSPSRDQSARAGRPGRRAARASSTVAPSNPWSSGRRAPRSSSAARASADSTSAGSPVDGRRRRRPRRRACARRTMRRRAGTSRPQPHARRPSASTVTSSHSRPHPAQVTGPKSAIDQHRIGERGQGGGHRARRARARRASAETSVHTGAPRLIVSPACGMSRTRPAGHQPGSGARRSRSANSTSFTFARPRRAAGRPRSGRPSPRAPRTCASKHPGPNSSSEAGGRGLTSSTHAWRPSQTASTPNAPRTPKRAATSSHTARS